MLNNPRLNVGIVIPTLNRPDFVIRQLEYYARVKSPHPIYIGDASNEENSKKLQDAIERLKGQISINYHVQPQSCTVSEANIDLYNKVKEEYCVFSGDDDYQIPRSLTKCAEFLENNPDYSTTGGHGLLLRLENNGAYGELKRLSDYPHKPVESSTAAERLLEFMPNYYVILWTVARTKQRRKCWEVTNIIEDNGFANEILPCAMFSVLGKSKVLDCLGFMRQVDNDKAPTPTLLQWRMNKNWNSSFNIFSETLAKEISAIDGINIDKARWVPYQAMSSYFAKNFPIEYNKIYGSKTGKYKRRGFLKKLKFRLGQNMPRVKKFYLQLSHSFPGSRREISYEVTRQNSPYYHDFQNVLDSFTGKYRNS